MSILLIWGEQKQSQISLMSVRDFLQLFELSYKLLKKKAVTKLKRVRWHKLRPIKKPMLSVHRLSVLFHLPGVACLALISVPEWPQPWAHASKLYFLLPFLAVVFPVRPCCKQYGSHFKSAKGDIVTRLCEIFPTKALWVKWMQNRHEFETAWSRQIKNYFRCWTVEMPVAQLRSFVRWWIELFLISN